MHFCLWSNAAALGQECIDMSSRIITAAAPGIQITPLERFEYYVEARKAFAVVQVPGCSITVVCDKVDWSILHPWSGVIFGTITGDMIGVVEQCYDTRLCSMRIYVVILTWAAAFNFFTGVGATHVSVPWVWNKIMLNPSCDAVVWSTLMNVAHWHGIAGVSWPSVVIFRWSMFGWEILLKVHLGRCFSLCYAYRWQSLLPISRLRVWPSAFSECPLLWLKSRVR